MERSPHNMWVLHIHQMWEKRSMSRSHEIFGRCSIGCKRKSVLSYASKLWSSCLDSHTFPTGALHWHVNIHECPFLMNELFTSDCFISAFTWSRISFCNQLFLCNQNVQCNSYNIICISHNGFGINMT
jgi:hypothetical protein